MRFGSALCLVAILNGGAVGLASAVEGGLPAYLLGSRDSLAGVVPPAGTYTGIDLISFAGDVSGLSIAGLPIRAETDVDVNLAKLSIPHAFERRL